MSLSFPPILSFELVLYRVTKTNQISLTFQYLFLMSNTGLMHLATCFEGISIEQQNHTVNNLSTQCRFQESMQTSSTIQNNIQYRGKHNLNNEITTHDVVDVFEQTISPAPLFIRAFVVACISRICPCTSMVQANQVAKLKRKQCNTLNFASN